MVAPSHPRRCQGWRWDRGDSASGARCVLPVMEEAEISWSALCFPSRSGWDSNTRGIREGMSVLKITAGNMLQDPWLSEPLTRRQEEGTALKQRASGGFTAAYIPRGKNQQAAAKFGSILHLKRSSWCQHLLASPSPPPPSHRGSLLSPFWLCHLERAEHGVRFLNLLKWELSAWRRQTPFN